MPLRCAIFDLDQTIAPTAGSLYASFNAGLRAVGRAEMSPPEIITLFGPSEWMALRRVVGDADFPIAFDAYLRRCVAMLPEVRLYPGIRELLEEMAARGVFRGMITGKGRATTEITLLHLGVRDLFDLVLTGDEIARPKPCADGIEIIMRRAGASPAETVMIGDMPADIGAARAAGVRAVAALWDCEWPGELRAAKPDLEFHAVSDLKRWLLSQCE